MKFLLVILRCWWQQIRWLLTTDICIDVHARAHTHTHKHTQEADTVKLVLALKVRGGVGCCYRCLGHEEIIFESICCACVCVYIWVYAYIFRRIYVYLYVLYMRICLYAYMRKFGIHF